MLWQYYKSLDRVSQHLFFIDTAEMVKASQTLKQPDKGS